MKFVSILEQFETFDAGTKIRQVPSYVNVECIELIRENGDGSILLFLTGRDKAMKIVDQKSIDTIVKATKIKTIKEGD